MKGENAYLLFVTDSTTQLQDMRAKLEVKCARLRNQLGAAEHEFAEIDTALRVLARLAGNAAAHVSSPASNENGAVIWSFVPIGEDHGSAPKDIHESLTAAGHDLNADLVRTQLWRMAKRGTLESENGKYWRSQMDSLSAKLAENVRHPDEPATEEDFHASPQGQIAASGGGFGSYADDFDDDVPF